MHLLLALTLVTVSKPRIEMAVNLNAQHIHSVCEEFMRTGVMPTYNDIDAQVQGDSARIVFVFGCQLCCAHIKGLVFLRGGRLNHLNKSLCG